jgi:hypothetical protein
LQLHHCQRRGGIVHSITSNHVLRAEFGDLDKHDSTGSIAMFNLHHCDRSI